MTTETTTRAEPDSLICDHCGEDAITSETGLFRDGDGSACMTCGFPGHVSADGEEAYWLVSDGDDGEQCNRPDCEECAELAIPTTKGDR